MAEKIMTNYRITEFCGGGEKVFGTVGEDILTGETFEIKRVSTDRSALEKLVETLNQNAVSLAHCYDVVRDFMYEAAVLSIK